MHSHIPDFQLYVIIHRYYQTSGILFCSDILRLLLYSINTMDFHDIKIKIDTFVAVAYIK